MRTYITCTSCHYVAGSSYHKHFYLSNKYPSGYKPICRKCTTAKSTEYYNKVGRNRVFLSKYGISVTQAVSIWEKQGKCCKGCSSKIPKPPSPMSPCDHSHLTGVVRGILCRPCNLALGLVKDNQQTLHNLILYLGTPS